MAYTIEARMDGGMPSLILRDALTGEERIHWRGDNVTNNESDCLSI